MLLRSIKQVICQYIQTSNVVKFNEKVSSMLLRLIKQSNMSVHSNK